MSTSRVMPVGSSTTRGHDSNALDPDSYTAHRLKHAFPEHLHLTSRRFFIGPIPEGWLNSNRKSWYKRRLELSSYSSRQQSFRAAADGGAHHRTLTGLDGPSTAARMSFSFPQPEDVYDAASSAEESSAAEEVDDEPQVNEARNVEPISTNEIPLIVGIEDQDEEGNRVPKALPIPADTKFDGTSEHRGGLRFARSPKPDSFKTAQEHLGGSSSKSVTPLHRYEHPDQPTDPESDPEEPPSNRGSFDPSGATQEGIETSSRTALLAPEGEGLHDRSLQQHDPTPLQDESTYQLVRSNAGVRFKISEEVHQRRHQIENKASRAKHRVKRLRRDMLREGTIVKMERMLVRCEITKNQVPDEFDENESLKIESRVVEKWREFVVVARKSKKQDDVDFRLQIYKTRVIPEIEDEKTKKKPLHEVKLDPKTTRVNLYSSLDKTVVIWHPYKAGTRIFVMRPISTAHSVEWYTFLRDALGWQRPDTLHVNVPDLDVVLKLEKPFEGLEAAGLNATDEETAIARTVAAERAVAGEIISQCMNMLRRDREWSSVIKLWQDTAKMGLAWKRYDRLEWVYGVHEQKMYGSMAMEHSHDLELRPKKHYPTSARGRKGKLHEEPPPIEGFLIRLTSQKGAHQRLGKAFFKRLYFSTHSQYLVFNRPAKATPPHPPRLATIGGNTVPSAREIVEKTPLMYDIEPYKLHNNEILWLSSGNPATVRSHDREAVEEARRNVANVLESDGLINMCYIRQVRVIKWGASPADDNLEEGSSSDVDFHQNVPDTRGEDGAAKQIDDDRVFEILLDNGLVIRLQAYSKKTRDEWISRLKKLVKYWKLRMAAEMDTYKAVRKANLAELNIDEELEAIIGQYAKKWEVSRSEASPELYNLCGISSCRSITMSGSLYLKPHRRAAFHRSQVILCGGKLLIYQATVRKSTGAQVRHIHQEKQQVVDLKDCYVYSGLIVEDDLLYQNTTFDANHPGMASLPRVYLDDGWTSADVDVMTCFVVWMNRKKGWFRTAAAALEEQTQPQPQSQSDGPVDVTTESNTKNSAGRSRRNTRAKLRRVGQLGVPGRGMVFKCRSRAERDHWVLSVAGEIERVMEQEAQNMGEQGEFRFDK
ncbi:hypothetical protein HRR83_000888 [Exophiala dermatitidis]|nr:hypothetical protein HRR75_000803 [Exophiala dermatitidis]KAJ4528137.1 hypothetical protein HRR74_000892 [Exophiala dermatitidis]KAJ4528770.1 hypothetical protein HRR73_001393 [Exophiala dermatitidis]KAJ4530156.1 hypothetical protein HRR76_009389 [Exophiala dermatitidis]KAJ4553099.1 hypothetical protein HRR78_003358 [Exophiala dermatitidis]